MSLNDGPSWRTQGLSQTTLADGVPYGTSNSFTTEPWDTGGAALPPCPPALELAARLFDVAQVESGSANTLHVRSHYPKQAGSAMLCHSVLMPHTAQHT